MIQFVIPCYFNNSVGTYRTTVFSHSQENRDTALFNENVQAQINLTVLKFHQTELFVRLFHRYYGIVKLLY